MLGARSRKQAAVSSGIKIRTKMLAVVIAPLVALLVVAIVGFTVLREARVGGPRYDRIASSSDLVADVLPPPAYIIEAYLTVQQGLSATQNEMGGIVARLQQLEQDFTDSIDRWSVEETDPAIRQQLLEGAVAPAREFFQLVDSEYIPDIQALNTVAARVVANGRLRVLYEQHRASIDQVVELARTRQTTLVSDTNSYINGAVIVLAVVFLIVLAASVLLGVLIARSIVRPVRALHRVATEDLPATVEALKSIDLDDRSGVEVPRIELDTGDELGDAAVAFNEVVGTAVGLASDQSKLRQHTADLMINLGKRTQVLLGNQLEVIERLESTAGDSSTRADLRQLDQLANRMRRNAESLLVLSGSRRGATSSVPVPVSVAIRTAVAELADSERVDVMVAPEDEVEVKAQFTVDVAHLLAEFIENGLQFSPPSTKVTVRTQRLKSGLRIWVSDSGIGMTESELADANDRISRPPEIDELNADQVGFQVVPRLTARLGARVRLQSHPSGGLAVGIDLPQSVFSADIEQVELARSGGRRPGVSLDPAPPLPAIAAVRPKPTDDPFPEIPDVGLRRSAAPAVGSAGSSRSVAAVPSERKYPSKALSLASVFR